jgi:hypothetical protein
VECLAGYGNMINTRPTRNYSVTDRILITALVFVAALLATSARAVDSRTFDYSFNAFGTAGLVHSSERQADFTTNYKQPTGPGFTHAWSVTPDSKVGAQLSGTFMDRLSAVVQVVSQYQADGTYKPDVEWANLKYQITPDADIRAGRIALPTFMYSDSVNVGYALPYVRIPLEIYFQLPITNSDGVDGTYRFHVGGITTTVQAYVGRFNSAVPQGYYDARQLRGITTTLEDDALTVHLSYQMLRYDFAQGGIVYNAGDPQSLLSIGASYDPGTWYIQGEWVRLPDDNLGLYYAGYLFGGYRIDKLTAYLGYARTYMTQPGSFDIPPIIDQRTSTLGLRWDLARHIDAKVQLDHTVLHGGLTSSFINPQPGFDPTGTVNILSLAVDFVW